MKKENHCKCGDHNYCQKCPPKKCGAKHCTRCRKDLCNPCFMVRLGGLQDGLNFRLRQMVCCEVEFQMEEEIVKGTIIFVGSNFVEIFVNGKPGELPTDCGCTADKKGKKRKKVNHPIGNTLILPIDKISQIKTLGCCHSKNPYR